MPGMGTRLGHLDLILRSQQPSKAFKQRLRPDWICVLEEGGCQDWGREAPLWAVVMVQVRMEHCTRAVAVKVEWRR